MQCKQCGKWFVEKSVDEIYCSLECWNRAQLDGIKYAATTKLYLNGEEVKNVDDFDLHFAEVKPKKRVSEEYD